MNLSPKAIAVTLLAGVMAVGMEACSSDLPDEPSAGTPQADVSILQAPANDEFANAVVIGDLPFSTSLNTSEATAEGDPANDCLLDASTVWYQFTPSADMRVNANTFGSDFDTGIAVYTIGTGTPPSLTQIVCNDDVILGNFVQSNVNFDAAGGTTYFFMVGSCCGQDGGNLVFNVNESVDLGVTIDPSGSVNASTGQATIRGTITCAEPVSGSLDVFVRQRIGRTFVNGAFFGVPFECDGVTAFNWEAQVVGDNGLFVGGRLQVDVFAFAFDRDFTQASATVNLKGKGK